MDSLNGALIFLENPNAYLIYANIAFFIIVIW